MFQTNPCWVEAAPTSAPAAPPSKSFRRTLVGLKHPDRHREGKYSCGFRRTLVGLKQSVSIEVSNMLVSFRRTLVGLKRLLDAAGAASPRRFQTNPCWVEASTASQRSGAFGRCFRRTLVGLKQRQIGKCRRAIGQQFQTNPCWVEALTDAAALAAGTRFRRTLVGLKRREPQLRRSADPFQTNPCWVEA